MRSPFFSNHPFKVVRAWAQDQVLPPPLCYFREATCSVCPSFPAGQVHVLADKSFMGTGALKSSHCRGGSEQGKRWQSPCFQEAWRNRFQSCVAAWLKRAFYDWLWCKLMARLPSLSLTKYLTQGSSKMAQWIMAPATTWWPEFNTWEPHDWKKRTNYHKLSCDTK